MEHVNNYIVEALKEIRKKMDAIQHADDPLVDVTWMAKQMGVSKNTFYVQYLPKLKADLVRPGNRLQMLRSDFLKWRHHYIEHLKKQPNKQAVAETNSLT